MLGNNGIVNNADAASVHDLGNTIRQYLSKGIDDALRLGGAFACDGRIEGRGVAVHLRGEHFEKLFIAIGEIALLDDVLQSRTGLQDAQVSIYQRA